MERLINQIVSQEPGYQYFKAEPGQLYLILIIWHVQASLILLSWLWRVQEWMSHWLWTTLVGRPTLSCMWWLTQLSDTLVRQMYSVRKLIYNWAPSSFYLISWQAQVECCESLCGHPDDIIGNGRGVTNSAPDASTVGGASWWEQDFRMVAHVYHMLLAYWLIVATFSQNGGLCYTLLAWWLILVTFFS